MKQTKEDNVIYVWWAIITIFRRLFIIVCKYKSHLFNRWMKKPLTANLAYGECRNYRVTIDIN